MSPVKRWRTTKEDSNVKLGPPHMCAYIHAHPQLKVYMHIYTHRICSGTHYAYTESGLKLTMHTHTHRVWPGTHYAHTHRV